MNHHILISAKIKDRVDLASPPPFPVRVEADLTAAISGMLTARHSPLYLLIVISCEERDLIRSFLGQCGPQTLYYRFVLLGSSVPGGMPDEEYRTVLHAGADQLQAFQLDFLAHKAFQELESEHEGASRMKDYDIALIDMKQDQDDLISIGRALSIEKDSDRLLRLILMLSKKITGADAGSIFMVEQRDGGGKQLRFRYSHTFSKNLPYEEFVMPLNKGSIAGYVAVTGRVLSIPDVYELSSGDPVSFNSSYDKEHGYRSKSMLVVPMRNHIDEIIGVIQLINSKEDRRGDSRPTGNEAFEIVLASKEDYENKVVPFPSRYETLMEAVAGQAAIAVENNRMIKQIQTQFEEFVKASVTAIESRDPATSGHSFRVARICTLMAEAINGEKEGYFRDMVFPETAIKELEYAALLHDFGKVYIDLAIFQKAKKLFPKELENLVLKLDYLQRYIELQYSLRENRLLYDRPLSELAGELGALNAQRDDCLGRIRKAKGRILELNEPTVTVNDPEKLIDEIMGDLQPLRCCDTDGKEFCVVSEVERVNLAIRRGSLNPLERKEIESHVVHTYNFVSKIPWPPEFKNIPEIAVKHHEYLDGSGYPAGLKGADSIPIQARMMAIADIYDALSATDRPYKKSIPLEKTLAILEEEARNNRLDGELVKLFLRHKIHERVRRGTSE